MYFLCLSYHEIRQRQGKNTAASAAVFTSCGRTGSRCTVPAWGLLHGYLPECAPESRSSHRRSGMRTDARYTQYSYLHGNSSFPILLFSVIVIDCPKGTKTYISFCMTIDFFPVSHYNICGICEFSQICIMQGGNSALGKKGILP